jgi:hypothetical protein
MKKYFAIFLLALPAACIGQQKKLTRDDSLRASFGHYYTYVCPSYTYRWQVKPQQWTMHLLDKGKVIDSIVYYPKTASYQTKQWRLYIDPGNYISNNFPRNCSCFTPR